MYIIIYGFSGLPIAPTADIFHVLMFYLFYSNEGSKLANLFGDAPSRSDQSLTYTAPKQPRKNTITAPGRR